MPNADRAAVAREVLTEMAQRFREDPLRTLGETGAQVVEAHRDEHYPAPAAPETVTVLTRRGVSVEWTRKEPGSWHSNHGTWVPADHISAELFARIASDARVLAELRDEIANSNKHQVDELESWNKRCAQLERERDAALRALEEKGLGARTPNSEDTETPLSSSPAPIPLGAVVDHLTDAINWLMGCGHAFEPGASQPRRRVPPYWWRSEFAKRAGITYDAERGVSALPHPVATRETVERVAAAIYHRKVVKSIAPAWSIATLATREECFDHARAALSAAGFTLEGA